MHFQFEFQILNSSERRVVFHQPSDCTLEDDRQFLAEVMVAVRITVEIVMDINRSYINFSNRDSVKVFRIDICG